MTLLVVGIGVPHLADESSVGDLADALNDDLGSFIGFFISFTVIGRYWLAHHQFFSRLAAMDQRLISLNLVYLMFIAFLPFPTVLLGDFFENPLTIVIYAVNVAIVSGLEVVLFRHAHRSGLFEREMPEEIYRWGVLMSLSPVLWFIFSIPLAFVSTSLAVVVWFFGIPFQAIANRWKPEGADELLVG